MGIEIVIKEACLIAGEEVASHADVGDQVEISSKEEASYLVRSGRALYLDKRDDATKGLNTATPDDLKRIKDMRRAALTAQQKASSQIGGDLSGIIAAAVTAGVREALAATAPAPTPAPAGGA